MEKFLFWLRSYKAPLIGLIIFTFGVVFHSEQLFYDAYPDSMPEAMKVYASFFIAISLEFIVLLIAVNFEHDNDFAINFFFLIYLIITSYFLDTFKESQSIGYYLIRAFVSILIAFMARTYADLVIQKLKDHINKKKINPSNIQIKILRENHEKEKLQYLRKIESLKKLINDNNQSFKKVNNNQIPINYGKN